ncbi:MAG: hypothetical protein ACOX81_10050 [Candidatus Heteroscillospira sp.]|jgi:hypothetical protein
MSFLSKKPVAIILAALIVAGSTFTGAKVDIEKQSRQVEELFYTGVDMEGYTHPSIYSQLQKRSEAANGLLSVGKSYELTSECEDLSQAREYMSYSGSVSGYYYNDCELENAFDVLKQELDKCELSERDAKAVETYVSTFKNAGGVIEQSGYNEAVRGFYRDVIYQFPAEWFYWNSDIDTPDYFGEMWY